MTLCHLHWWFLSSTIVRMYTLAHAVAWGQGCWCWAKPTLTCTGGLFFSQSSGGYSECMHFNLVVVVAVVYTLRQNKGTHFNGPFSCYKWTKVASFSGQFTVSLRHSLGEKSRVKVCARLHTFLLHEQIVAEEMESRRETSQGTTRLPTILSFLSFNTFQYLPTILHVSHIYHCPLFISQYSVLAVRLQATTYLVFFGQACLQKAANRNKNIPQLSLSTSAINSVDHIHHFNLKKA